MVYDMFGSGYVEGNYGVFPFRQGSSGCSMKLYQYRNGRFYLIARNGTKIVDGKVQHHWPYVINSDKPAPTNLDWTRSVNLSRWRDDDIDWSEGNV
jgi:hypothetical protein